MAEKKPRPSRKVSVTNTKQEVLDAYNDLAKQIEEKSESDLKPQEKVEEKSRQQAVAVADSLSTDGIIQSMSALKGEIGKVLGELSDRLENEVGKYRQIRKAVEVKEAELEEIYEIQKSASSLAALIEAQHQKRYEFETDLADQKEALEQEIHARRSEWEQEKARNASETRERDTAEAKRREREKEEYLYAFQRERQLATDQFEDERARLEREILMKREEMTRELAERERVIGEKETELNDLRQRTDAFPSLLDATVAAAVKDAVDRIEWEARAKEELSRKEFEGERNVLNTRIASLEQMVKEQHDQIVKLSQQTEKAYSQVQTMAVKAIEGASSFASMGHAVGDQPRKSSQEN